MAPARLLLCVFLCVLDLLCDFWLLCVFLCVLDLLCDFWVFVQKLFRKFPCQSRCDFVVFRQTGNVEKWRVNVYSL